MNVTIPDDLSEAIEALAKRNRISTEEAVRQAVLMLLQSEEELRKELSDWQGARDHALRLVLGDEEEQ